MNAKRILTASGVSAALAAVAALAFLASAPAPARAADKKLGNADEMFVMDAAAGGLSEVELGKLAETRAASPDVKAFGQRMVQDHSKANEQLWSIAKDANIQLSSTLKGKHKEMYDKLAALSGADFDKHYMHHMVLDHKEDVEAFKKEAANGTDPKVKAFAANTLKVIEQHYELAKGLAPKVGAATDDSSSGSKKDSK
jgi:putative membrane protein